MKKPYANGKENPVMTKPKSNKAGPGINPFALLLDNTTDSVFLYDFRTLGDRLNILQPFLYGAASRLW